MDTAKEKTANTPMELVLIALCGCTASDVVGILRKKREPFTSLEVSPYAETSRLVNGNQAGVSRRWRSVAQGDGRRRSALEREVLFRFSDAGEDGEDYSRD